MRFRWWEEGKPSCVNSAIYLSLVLMLSFRDMVSLIPRLSSFAVSGTPARAQVADLMHVLK